MVSVRSRYVLQIKQPNCPRLVFSPLRRGIFLGAAALLTVSLISGLSADPHSFAERPGGTLFFLLLVCVSTGIGVHSRKWEFAIDERVIRYQRGIIGLPVKTTKYSLDDLEGVQVEAVRLLSESFSPRNKDSRSFFERRKLYFKLVLVAAEKRVYIDDGTDGDHMQQIGSALAGILRVPYLFVEL